MPPPSITLLSMAIAVRDWASAHDRLPRLRDCTAENGFPHHYTTIWRHFGANPDFSALMGVATERLPSATQAYRVCLGPACSVTFPNEGNHIRLCAACRKRIFVEV